jgi:hypothetical protein
VNTNPDKVNVGGGIGAGAGAVGDWSLQATHVDIKIATLQVNPIRFMVAPSPKRTASLYRAGNRGKNCKSQRACIPKGGRLTEKVHRILDI